MKDGGGRAFNQADEHNYHNSFLEFDVKTKADFSFQFRLAFICETTSMFVLHFVENGGVNALI